MNLANKLTLTRIILIPVFAILLLSHYLFLAICTFAVASVTDALDGIIARTKGQKTRLGFFLDPAADKLLLNTSFLALAILERLPFWLAIIVISRDILILLGVIILYLTGERKYISPRLVSKTTTTFQMLTVLTALINQWNGWLSLFLVPCVWITAALTIMSGINYIYIAAKMFNEG